MQELAPLGEYLRFVVTLTAVLDPFLAVPIFVGITASRSDAERIALARVVTFTVFGVLTGSALFGEALLHLIGASLPTGIERCGRPDMRDKHRRPGLAGQQGDARDRLRLAEGWAGP